MPRVRRQNLKHPGHLVHASQVPDKEDVVKYDSTEHEKFLTQEVRPLGTTVQLKLFGGKTSGQKDFVIMSTPAPSDKTWMSGIHERHYVIYAVTKIGGLPLRECSTGGMARKQ